MLDDESAIFCATNMVKGLMKVTSYPYGISSMPSIFKQIDKKLTTYDDKVCNVLR